MKKRLLSALLVLAMVLSLVPAMSFTASAAEAADVYIRVGVKDSISDDIWYDIIDCYSIQEANDAIVKTVQKSSDKYCSVKIAHTSITHLTSVFDAPIVLPAGGNYLFDGYPMQVSTTGRPRSIVQNYGNTVMSKVNFANTDSRNNNGGYCIQNYGTLRLIGDNSISGARYGIENGKGASLYIEDNYYSTNISGTMMAIINDGYLKMTTGNLAKPSNSAGVSLSNGSNGVADIYGGTIAGNVNNSETLNYYGGTIKGSVNNSGTLNYYGGETSGNVTNETSYSASEVHTLNILGGEIKGDVTSFGTAEISGGKIGGKLINNGEMTVYGALTGGIENNKGTLKDLLGDNAFYYNKSGGSIDVGSASSYEGEIGVALSGLSLLTEPNGTKHFLRDEEIIPYLNEHQKTSGILDFRNGIVIENDDDSMYLYVKNLTMRGNATIKSKGTYLFSCSGETVIDGLTLISEAVTGGSEFPSAVVYNTDFLIIKNSTLKGYTAGSYVDCPVLNGRDIQISNSTIDGTLCDQYGKPLSGWLGACQRFVNSNGQTVDLSAVGQYSGSLKVVDDPEAHEWTEATCQFPATCTKCGMTKGELAPHAEYYPATCTEPMICKACGAEVGNPLGHDYDALYVVKEATETTPAEYHAVCTRCEETTDSYAPTALESTTVKTIKAGDVLKPGATLLNDYKVAFMNNDCTVCVNGEKVDTIAYNGEWTATECVRCTSVFTFLTKQVNFETYCDYTEATCKEPATCVYCGETKGEKASHDFSGGVCTNCGVGIFEFVTKNLALDSSLAFRFKGYLHDENPADDAYMEFKVGNIRTEKVALKDAVKDEQGRYVFTCYLNVLEVDEKIEAIFHDGEITVERKNPLSVTDYLDQVLAKHQGDTEEDRMNVALVNAVSNYAHYGQLAIDETHTEFEVGEGGKYHGTEARSTVTLKTADALSAYAAVKKTKEGYTALKTTSRGLILDDETAIVVYLTPANADYEPAVKVTDKDGAAVDFTCVKQPNGKWKIVIPGIAAHRLADTFTVDVDNGGIVYTNLSALSYAYSILTSSKSEAYKMAVSALYDYYLAAVAYKEFKSGGHDFGDLISEVPATCTETGLKAHYHCSICGKVFDESKNETTLQDLMIGVVDHTFAAYSYNKTEHWQECTVCGAQTEREAHDFVDKDGLNKCTICGYVKLDEIPIDPDHPLNPFDPYFPINPLVP